MRQFEVKLLAVVLTVVIVALVTVEAVAGKHYDTLPRYKHDLADLSDLWLWVSGEVVSTPISD